MAFFLLSWHGALVGYTGLHMHPASFTDVLFRAVSPVVLHDDGAVEPCDAFTKVVPVDSIPNRPLIALKANAHYLSSRGLDKLDAAPICAAWEHFLAIPTTLLPLLKDLTTRDWHENGRWVGRAVCHEHHVHLGDHKWPAEALQAERKGDTLTLWSEDSDQRVTLTQCPSRTLSALLETLTERLQMGEIRPSQRTPWAVSEELREHILKVCVNPGDTGYLLHLARECGFFELWDLAAGLLSCARTQDTNPDLIYYAAILALRTKEYETAAQLLHEALTTRFPDITLERIQPLLTRLKGGEDALLDLPRQLRRMGLSMFDGLFNQLLVPMPLARQNGHDLRQAYSERFEETCTGQSIPHRLKLLAAEAHLNGISYWEEVNMAHASWLAGLCREADTHYANAKALAIETKINPIHYNCGVFSWLSEGECNSLSSRAVPDRLGVSDWKWHFSPEENAAAIPPALGLVFGCDSKYFRFIPKLILSLVRACRADPSGGAIHLFIGVEQPTMEQLTFLTTVSEWLATHDPKVKLSFAHGTLTYRDGATYTAIRYLMLPEIVARFRCPLITADCDGYFPADFVALWRQMADSSDYGFRLYAYNHEGKQVMGEPWGFGAGISYFGEPDLLPPIAHFLSDYLNTAYSPQNPTNWCVDQCALAAAFRRFVAPRWNDLRIKFMDEGAPLMVMPHHVGGKEALLSHDGSVSMVDVVVELARHTPASASSVSLSS
ncbi:hypothetical protein [Acetobacter tropicalis]|uniref:Uncharacterized protein n=1 Tax=Acetobacter tropicalis TaxID=104102 RepID=A0A094YJJ3_9PROT|nr:hypothetical protein [Acetobacter tropicalis]KGB20759.1 hypothetical protein AtDm6_3538 [Acetobacter tropicalis]MDO8172196.1 hypothetical protein [Acetobacter tropicalis]